MNNGGLNLKNVKVEHLATLDPSPPTEKGSIHDITGMNPIDKVSASPTTPAFKMDFKIP